MNIEEIIRIITDFSPIDEADLNYDNESYFYDIMDQLEISDSYEMAIDPIFCMMEKYPHLDFGSPGPLVHTLEKFKGRYEDKLFKSLNRKPTPLTVWMLNRMINGEKNSKQKNELIERLKSLLSHSGIDDVTKNEVQFFIDFQER
jgi:hypothetical protein